MCAFRGCRCGSDGPCRVSFSQYLLAMTASLLLEEALKLPPQEREQLCEELWDSLEASDDDLTPEQLEELKRRLKEHKENPGDVVSWNDIKARWSARYGWNL